MIHRHMNITNIIIYVFNYMQFIPDLLIAISLIFISVKMREIY